MFKKNDSNIWLDWNIFYNDIVNQYDSLYIVTRKADFGDFIIGFLDKNENKSKTQNPTVGSEEKITVGMPKILWTTPINFKNYYGYDITNEPNDNSYLNVLSNNHDSRIMLAILGVKKEDIKAVDFTSSNVNTFSITNSTRQDLKTAVFYNIDLRSGTNTNSLDWLSARIVSSSGNSVTSKIGVTTYDQISNDPIGILFIEDPSSKGTIVKDKSILSTPKTDLLSGINEIYHQSIMDLKDITQIEKVDLNYDFNKNGCFDYYSSSGIEQKEYHIIKNYIESIPDRNNLTYLFFISNLHTNYLLWADANKGSTEIDIIDSNIPIYYLEKGQIYTIGYGDKQQQIEIMDEPIDLHVPGSFRVVRLKIDRPLKYDYTTDDAIWDEKLGLAFTK